MADGPRRLESGMVIAVNLGCLFSRAGFCRRVVAEEIAVRLFHEDLLQHRQRRQLFGRSASLLKWESRDVDYVRARAIRRGGSPAVHLGRLMTIS